MSFMGHVISFSDNIRMTNWLVKIINPNCTKWWHFIIPNQVIYNYILYIIGITWYSKFFNHPELLPNGLNVHQPTSTGHPCRCSTKLQGLSAISSVTSPPRFWSRCEWNPRGPKVYFWGVIQMALAKDSDINHALIWNRYKFIYIILKIVGANAYELVSRIFSHQQYGMAFSGLYSSRHPQ